MFVVTSVVQFWSEWGLRISVLGSLAAYTILGLLSGTRRRSAYGRHSILQWAVVLILWAAYQAAELSATAALGSLSLSGSDASADEHQLIAFWAPFLLLHLGGPDNMTAYTLEDNMLSLRKRLEMILQLLGVMYAIWNYIYRRHSWVLLAASVIMLVTGGVRYVERAWALWRANLENMQHSSKKKDADGSSEISRSTSTSTEVVVESSSSRSLGWEWDLADDEALLRAQDLFHIWRRALVDSSVDPRSTSQRTSEKIFSLSWSSMCQVVEMELSLMYEVLYTKASLAHTCRAGTCYLVIRLMSPPAYAAAGWLFWLYSNKEGRRLRGSFVVITCLLLGAAFAMDVVWLLRALGSTWTHYFLKKNVRCRPWAWFHRTVLCAWLRLHRAVVYLDPLRLVFGIDPVRHRLWSGTIGRYNLLRECTAAPPPLWRSWLAAKLRLEDTSYLSELPQDAKRLLFERVRLILPTSHNLPRPNGDAYTMTVIRTRWGKEAVRRNRNLFAGKGLPKFGREFEEDVLVWHIATCIFLPRIARRIPPESLAHVEAIEVMSEYLMFLVAVRRQMLPGLTLHSLLEETRETLVELWDGGEGASRYNITDLAAANKEKLATILRRTRKNNQGWALDHDGKLLVSDAVEIASALTNSSRYQHKVPQLLDLVFSVWVDKLLYAGVRCSRESHAKQLSAGGELTTVLWMTVHHAGLFRIGERKPFEPPPRPAPPPPPPKVEPPPPPRPAKEEPAPPPPEPKEEPAPPPPEPPMLFPYPWPYPWPEEAEPVPEGEDPEDAAEYDMPIKYVTLY